jgi:hypothetical protein
LSYVVHLLIKLGKQRQLFARSERVKGKLLHVHTCRAPLTISRNRYEPPPRSRRRLLTDPKTFTRLSHGFLQHCTAVGRAWTRQHWHGLTAAGHVHIWSYITQSIVKTFELTDVPVRAGRFVARKNWIVAGGDSRFVEAVHQLTWLEYRFR